MKILFSFAHSYIPYKATSLLACIIFEDRLRYCKHAKAEGFAVVGVFDEESRDDTPEMQHICDDYIYSLSKMMKSQFSF